MMLKRVVAIRHAKPKSEGFANDTMRPLSEEGVSTQRILTEKIKTRGVIPDIIFTSPLLRAHQTAEVISEVYGGVPIVDFDALGNDFRQEEIMNILMEPDQMGTLFLVGHAPTLGDFVNDLVGENVLPSGLFKSGAAVVDFSGKPALGQGKLLEYYHP